jgi:hypothetical protein
MAMHISPQNDDEALLIKTYALTLRNALRIKRLYGTAKNGREVVLSSDKRLCATLGRLNAMLDPLLARCKELEKSFSTLTGCRDTLDPMVLIPLYENQYKPNDFFDEDAGHSTHPENPLTNIRQVLYTDNPIRYFLYRESLWVAHNEYSYTACAAKIDNLLVLKVKPLPVRQGITEPVRIFVWRRDQGQCAKCGSKEKLEFDHIVPVAKGGSNTARNIELLCETCNRKKGSRIS